MADKERYIIKVEGIKSGWKAADSSLVRHRLDIGW